MSSVGTNMGCWVLVVDNPKCVGDTAAGPRGVSVWSTEAQAIGAAAELLERYLELPDAVIDNSGALVKRLLDARKFREAVNKWNSARPKGTPIFLVMTRDVNRFSEADYDVFAAPRKSAGGGKTDSKTRKSS